MIPNIHYSRSSTRLICRVYVVCYCCEGLSKLNYRGTPIHKTIPDANPPTQNQTRPTLDSRKSRIEKELGKQLMYTFRMGLADCIQYFTFAAPFHNASDGTNPCLQIPDTDHKRVYLLVVCKLVYIQLLACP
jgi:hypothetical protein